MLFTSDIKRDIDTALTQSQNSWLQNAVQQLNETQDIENELLYHSSTVRRALATEPLNTQQVTTNQHKLPVDVAIRGLFLFIAINNKLNTTPAPAENTFSKLIRHYYQYGDEHEKCALLTLLPILDEHGYGVQTAIKACRCNSVREYSAIALNNNYPAAFFPELNFNQLVLKSLFMGLDINQIQNLAQRLNPKLSNMCFAYAIEQALADRVPPASLWLAVKLQHLDKENQLQQQKYLQHFKQVCAHHKTVIERVFPTSQPV